MLKSLRVFSLMLVVFFFSSFTFENIPTPKSHLAHPIGINLDFVLVNHTGYTIENVYVAPTTQREWGEDIMGKDLLLNGESVEISFETGETTKNLDIYVTFEGYDADEDVYWEDFNLSKIEEISLYYDAKTGKTWAETK